MRAHLLSLSYRFGAEQFMPEPTKASAVAAVVAAHRQMPFRADLLRLTPLLRAYQLPGS